MSREITLAGVPLAKVMVVDDEREIRELVSKMLRDEGIEVLEAGSGRECLEMLEKGENPDLVLLDVMMPEMDGWEVCRRIKGSEKTKGITVTMLTVKDQDEDKITSLGEAGADWHISKPIEKGRFLNTVSWLLGRKR